ncbi:MAG: tRNA lysidine(34) synthetase TilS, partial [Burkholderiales bacterium]|nr:tRNA lysidine(34) synthetase TilS [Burkholderiales bacterium]
MNTPSCDATIQDAISFAVTQFDHPASVLVGFSGGLDSVVLLDALHRLQTPHIVRIIAAHVHHGISPHADDWLSFCETFCAERDIPFLFRKIELRRIPQSSLEEEARNARRAALRSMAIEAQADTIALAHHQDDQVEALLLQLLRGAGPHGLAAMASWQPRYDANIALWRPFLILPRQKLAEYAAVRRLRWIEDESNGDIGFKRNYLRHRVFPVIAQAFPAYRKTLARAALLQADVASMIDQSLPASIIEFPSDFPISLDDFTRLPDDLARHTLRRAIRNAGLRAPNYRHLTEMTR